MDQLGQTPTKQEIMLDYRKPQRGVLSGTSDVDKRLLQRFYFQQKYSYIRYGFIFTAKYNIFPVCLITSKHIMYS